ncbi:hypothetical protein WISP_124621 [Willisornis vidua]|uniref:Uncharacterized protein n=1 Tax=Willisornis vidua TaxID=1566151 RepID=A0ABQ9CWJ0_9PASS|nr:hypothetical protein WISP_124621 [Willisornis vidua]
MSVGSKMDPPLAKAKPNSNSVEEGSDRMALVGTWQPARVNPPQHPSSDRVGQNLQTVFRLEFEMPGQCPAKSLVMKLYDEDSVLLGEEKELIAEF